ncbi:unnamed protein product [Musa textilis]
MVFTGRMEDTRHSLVFSSTNETLILQAVHPNQRQIKARLCLHVPM